MRLQLPLFSISLPLLRSMTKTITFKTVSSLSRGIVSRFNTIGCNVLKQSVPEPIDQPSQMINFRKLQAARQCDDSAEVDHRRRGLDGTSATRCSRSNQINQIKSDLFNFRGAVPESARQSMTAS